MERYRVKEETPETSRNHRPEQNRDLKELLNDRVELLQQVFSCLRTKEIQSVIPDSIKHLPIKNVKELCLEELLGISSKRLAAVLSGAVPPSDTESSSEEQRPPMSLDSISSDESALKKAVESKKKRRRHKEKKRSKKKESSKAERGGLTVLELLELQARARAIRAQLLAEPQPAQTKNDTTSASVVVDQSGGEDDDVLIKEEPPEVVELISTDDDEEKPAIATLDNTAQQNEAVKQEDKETASSETDIPKKSTVIKRNDLTIIVPKAPPSKKIKLKRDKLINKPVESSNSNATVEQYLVEKENPPFKDKNTKQPVLTEDITPKMSVAISDKPAINNSKTKKKKSKKSLKNFEDDSDNDEIMLQLSDSEKRDLLEDFYPKQKKKRLSSNTEDSDASSSEDEKSSQDLESSLSPLNTKSKKTSLKTHEEEINITPNKDSEKNTKSKNLVTKDLVESKNLTSLNDEQIEDKEANHYKESINNPKNTDKQELVLSMENQCDAIAEKRYTNDIKNISIEKNTEHTLSGVNTETKEDKTNDSVISPEEKQVLDTKFKQHNVNSKDVNKFQPKADSNEEANTDPISNNEQPSQITEASKKRKSKKVKKSKKKKKSKK